MRIHSSSHSLSPILSLSLPSSLPQLNSLPADEDDHSNSSNDSDQLHHGTGGGGGGGGYHRGTQSDGGTKTSAPVCRHESISIAAMEDCPTDHEVCSNPLCILRLRIHEVGWGMGCRLCQNSLLQDIYFS